MARLSIKCPSQGRPHRNQQGSNKGATAHRKRACMASVSKNMLEPNSGRRAGRQPYIGQDMDALIGSPRCASRPAATSAPVQGACVPQIRTDMLDHQPVWVRTMMRERGPVMRAMVSQAASTAPCWHHPTWGRYGPCVMTPQGCLAELCPADKAITLQKWEYKRRPSATMHETTPERAGCGQHSETHRITRTTTP